MSFLHSILLRKNIPAQDEGMQFNTSLSSPSRTPAPTFPPQHSISDPRKGAAALLGSKTLMHMKPAIADNLPSSIRQHLLKKTLAKYPLDTHGLSDYPSHVVRLLNEEQQKQLLINSSAQGRSGDISILEQYKELKPGVKSLSYAYNALYIRPIQEKLSILDNTEIKVNGKKKGSDADLETMKRGFKNIMRHADGTPIDIERMSNKERIMHAVKNFSPERTEIYEMWRSYMARNDGPARSVSTQLEQLGGSAYEKGLAAFGKNSETDPLAKQAIDSAR